MDIKIDSTTVLGIWGAITGTIALTMHYLNFRKDKPNLKIKYQTYETNFLNVDGNEDQYIFLLYKITNSGNKSISVDEASMIINGYIKNIIKITELRDWRFEKNRIKTPFTVPARESIQLKFEIILTPDINFKKVNKLDILLELTNADNKKINCKHIIKS